MRKNKVKQTKIMYKLVDIFLYKKTNVIHPILLYSRVAVIAQPILESASQPVEW